MHLNNRLKVSLLAGVVRPPWSSPPPANAERANRIHRFLQAIEFGYATGTQKMKAMRAYQAPNRTYIRVCA